MKETGMEMDDVIHNFRRQLKPNKLRQTSKDTLGSIRELRRSLVNRYQTQRNKMKLDLTTKVLKLLESDSFYSDLSKIYEKYDAKRLHQKLSDGA
jgi:small-conductance mechanosensitive channel